MLAAVVVDFKGQPLILEEPVALVVVELALILPVRQLLELLTLVVVAVLAATQIKLAQQAVLAS